MLRKRVGKLAIFEPQALKQVTLARGFQSTIKHSQSNVILEKNSTMLKTTIIASLVASA